MPSVENNDVGAVECVNQKDDNSLGSTTDVLYSIRDLLEVNDPTTSSAASPAAASAEQRISSLEGLLSSMKDMLETRLHSDSQLRQQTDENQEMMREWMIAAAVIDRICFIVFSLCFIVGTTVLFVLATCIER